MTAVETKPTTPGDSGMRNAILGGVGVVVVLGILIVLARPANAPDDLSPLAAVVLGLVEGLTEYLPVSSTGHLLVTNELLGLGGTTEADLALETYAICIQLGAIMAVILLYRNRLRQMLRGLFGNDDDGRQLLLASIAAFVPTVVIALALKDPIRDNLFGPTTIATTWFIGGLAILWLARKGTFSRGGAALTEITIRQAVIIGVAQSIALLPGTSRSLVTIVAAVLVGLSLAAAVEFSFLLGLATLTAATLYEGKDNGGTLIDTFGYTAPLLGLVVAFISAAVAIKWMVAWLEQRGFELFGWYRIVIGVAAGVAIAAGALAG